MVSFIHIGKRKKMVNKKKQKKTQLYQSLPIIIFKMEVEDKTYGIKMEVATKKIISYLLSFFLIFKII